MSFDAYIFDLDGTILDTLPDLVELTNAIMDARGFPRHTTEEVLSFIGSGACVLLMRSVPPETQEAEIAEMERLWMELYPVYGHRLTKPYDGMPEALATLKERGAKLGVLSNKIDDAARDVVGEHYPGVFDIVRGECPEVPRKPDPTGLLQMMADLGVQPERVAYVGDSGSTDMAVACAAGAFPVGVSWGYQSVDELKEHGARVIISTPAQLLGL